MWNWLFRAVISPAICDCCIDPFCDHNLPNRPTHSPAAGTAEAAAELAAQKKCCQVWSLPASYQLLFVSTKSCPFNRQDYWSLWSAWITYSPLLEIQCKFLSCSHFCYNMPKVERTRLHSGEGELRSQISANLKRLHPFHLPLHIILCTFIIASLHRLLDYNSNPTKAFRLCSHSTYAVGLCMPFYIKYIMHLYYVANLK